MRINIIILGLMLLAPACTPEPRFCYPGDWRACDSDACSGDVQGYQQCQDDGAAYRDCDCSGTVPGGVDDGTPPDDYYYYY